MTTSEEILAIANQIANEGKQPSVALIKARLNKSVPLPSIVKVLKTWQHDPDFTSVSGASSSQDKDEKQGSNELSETISHAIAPLHQELKEIKALLSQLVNEPKP